MRTDEKCTGFCRDANMMAVVPVEMADHGG